MPKINARENTRNRSQAKKRERNRLLRASLLAPAKPAQSSAKAKKSSVAAAEAK